MNTTERLRELIAKWRDEHKAEGPFALMDMDARDGAYLACADQLESALAETRQEPPAPRETDEELERAVRKIVDKHVTLDFDDYPKGCSPYSIAKDVFVFIRSRESAEPPAPGLREAAEDFMDAWLTFYAVLPDGEYPALGDMRQAAIAMHKALAATPAQTERERVIEARLEEAEWWALYAGWLNTEGTKRLNELRALAAEKAQPEGARE